MWLFESCGPMHLSLLSVFECEKQLEYLLRGNKGLVLCKRRSEKDQGETSRRILNTPLLWGPPSNIGEDSWYSIVPLQACLCSATAEANRTLLTEKSLNYPLAREGK